MEARSVFVDSSVLVPSREQFSGIALYGIGFVSLILIWAMTSIVVENDVFLPSPLQVAQALQDLAAAGELWSHIAASLKRVVMGFSLGSIIALAIGLTIGLVQRAERAAEPMIELFRSIPPYALIPFAFLAFGIHDSGKVFLLAYATFFPVLVSAASAVANVPRKLAEVAYTLGASRSFVVFRVIIPSAAPQITVGLRLGFGAAWICLIAAEMLGSSQGLGYMIADARETLNTTVVVAGMLVIGLIGYVSNWLFLCFERTSLAR